MPLSNPTSYQPNHIAADLEEILTCPICMNVIDHPKTLSCFHNFCTKCIDEYSKKYTAIHKTPCPVCRQETERGKEPQNFLVNEVLDWFHASKCEDRQCNCCMKKPASFSCIDCKIDLCNECNENHPRIPLCKNHRVIPFKEQTSVLVDKLVFCITHSNEVVRFNCKQCEAVLCIECKVLFHEGHETESVHSALERIVPIIEAKAVELTKSKENKQQEIFYLEAKMKSFHDRCDQAREGIQNKKLEIIEAVEGYYKELYDKIQSIEEHINKKIQKKKFREENLVKEVENILTWTKTALSTAQNECLLNECQGRLKPKLENMQLNMDTSFKEKQLSKYPVFKPVLFMPSIEDLFGKLENSDDPIITTFLHNGSLVNRRLLSSGIIPLMNEGIWKIKQSTPVLNNKNPWHRICYVRNDIWLPCPDENCIYTFGAEGNSLNILSDEKIKGHRSLIHIEINHTAEVILASDVGLFVLDRNGESQYCISDGEFSDVVVSDDQIFGLEWKKNLVHILVRYGGKWNVEETVDVGEYNSKARDTLCIVNDNLYICSWQMNKIHKFQNGKAIKSYGVSGPSTKVINPGALHYTYLCAADEEKNILVADRDHNCLQILNSKETWEIVKIEKLKEPTDVLFRDENNLWCLCKGGKKLVQYYKDFGSEV